MKELQYTIAQVFKIRGKEEITVREFIFALSFDLKWFSPEDAKKILYMAKRNNLVKIDGDKVYPKFKVSSISIPFGFTPSEEIWKERSLIEKIKERIMENSGMSREEVEREIKRKMEEFRNLIIPEVAALLVASKYCDVKDLKEEVMELLFSSSSKAEQETH